MFVLAEYAPEEDVFHKGGKADVDFINFLRGLILLTLSNYKSLTVKELKDEIDKSGTIKKAFTLEHTQRMIDRLVLSRKVGEYTDQDVWPFCVQCFVSVLPSFPTYFFFLSFSLFLNPCSVSRDIMQLLILKTSSHRLTRQLFVCSVLCASSFSSFVYLFSLILNSSPLLLFLLALQIASECCPEDSAEICPQKCEYLTLWSQYADPDE